MVGETFMFGELADDLAYGTGADGNKYCFSLLWIADVSQATAIRNCTNDPTTKAREIWQREI